jgi:thiosulfate dehydrogenase [quinone] large subunit
MPPRPRQPAGRTRRPPPPPTPSLSERLRALLAADPTVALVPLRLFLGVTFCFAGLQKLANPNFFRPASPISIQAQIRAAERTSPIHGLLHHLNGVSGLLGLIIALGELAVGLGVLAGVLTRVAALGGMILSFGLFLTVSFHSRPYYTGADIGYVFAFSPLLIAGAGSRFTLPALIDHLTGLSSIRGRYGHFDEDRRRFLALSTLGAFGVLAAALAAGAGRLAGGVRTPRSTPDLSAPRPAPPGPATTTAPTPTTTAGGPSTTTAPNPTPPGTHIGPASGVPVGGAASFQDPSSGDPAVILQPKAGQFLAFDAVCPHAGCTVEFAASQDVLVCPCHGSLFNASTGAVEQGPAASGLQAISVIERSGQLFVT